MRGWNNRRERMTEKEWRGLALAALIGPPFMIGMTALVVGVIPWAIGQAWQWAVG